MCFTVTTVFPSRRQAIAHFRAPKIARRNFSVYKILEENSGQLISPYYGKVWTPNKLEKIGRFSHLIDDTLGGGVELMIERGLHVFRKDIWEDAGQLWHSKRWMMPSYNVIKVCLFTIPKGARYFMNKYEIVTDQLIFKKVVY